MRMLPLVVATSLVTFLAAQNDPPKHEPKAEAPAGSPAPRSARDALTKYAPAAGPAKVGDVALVKLGEGWLWLDGGSARSFLADLGNRPGSSILGVAIPPDYVESQSFAVYSYVDDGHVKDDEAPDYDDLLQQMQDAAAEDNKQRKAAGLQGVALVGWAEAPHYDKEQKKLYWAERLHFDGEDGDTLNYNVRVLGRTGHLVVNGVGSIEQLASVAAHNKELLTATEFVEGKRYSDFQPEYDKLAAYGIGGLVAGKLALKVGLFAKLGGLLLKFLKPILIGVAVIGAGLVKVFGGRKKDAAAGA